MPIQIVRNDITKMDCDAIVNAANSTLLGGGGVDGAIHRAAGKGLLLECMKLGGCKVGEAKITNAYNLPCKYVIHTVGPKWRGGNENEKQLLQNCYINSLNLALSKDCRSVAFPLISSGIYGYPKDKALRVAVDAICSFLNENEMLVYIVVFDKSSFGLSEKMFSDISSYIDDNYVYEQEMLFSAIRNRFEESTCLNEYSREIPNLSSIEPIEASVLSCQELSLEKMINQIDESFSQMLLRKIDEKGMTDSQCYKKANVDRKLFSKIRNDAFYKPSKPTAIAFAIALELTLDETKEMLMKAGYALSHSNKFDIIIEYFIRRGNYNVFEINEALFAFDQNLLG